MRATANAVGIRAVLRMDTGFYTGITLQGLSYVPYSTPDMHLLLAYHEY